MSATTDLIDAQISAYRARDVEGFVSFYSPDSLIKDGHGNILMKGTDSIKEMYGQLFENSPDLVAHISNRMTVGDYVIDEEHLDGFNLPGYPRQIHALVLYEVADGKIRDVTLLT